ncbi:MAG: MCP four helix bundle domain-containing protein, partial [Betaproteobacteria bacterium]|nr:MCP four helix bundle domain-containing protein [Betaproteobacteria bacterium]
MFKNMRIGNRLALGFGILGLLFAASGAFALRQMQTIKTSTDAVIEGQWPQYVAMGQVLDSVEEMLRDSEAAFSDRSSSTNVAGVRTKWQHMETANDQRLATVVHLAATPTGRAFARKVKRELRAYYSTEDQFLAALGSADPSAAHLLHQQVRPQASALVGEIRHFKTHITHVFAKAAGQSNTIYAQARTLEIAIASLVLLLAAGFAFWVTRSITVPLREAVDVSNQLAEGDLTARIEARSR